MDGDRRDTESGNGSQDRQGGWGLKKRRMLSTDRSGVRRFALLLAETRGMRERDQAAKKKMLVRCGARVPGGNQGGTTATNHQIGLRGAVTERDDDAVRTGSDPAPHALCPPAVGDSHADRGLYQSRVRVGARIRVRFTMAVGVGPQGWPSALPHSRVRWPLARFGGG